jgi:hypothetical protein
MAERYGIDENGNGMIDLPNTFAYAHPSGFTVRFDATCAGVGNSPIAAYDWEISGNGLASPLHFSSVQPSVPNLHEGLYNVRLTVTAQDGTTNSTTEPIYLKDWLIVSIGDSYGSGEGNPVRDQVLDSFGFTRTGAKWADGRDDHRRCHRSTLAASSLAALSVEWADPHSTVTYISVACSGATISKEIFKDPFHPNWNEFEGTGILGGYRGAEPPDPNDYNPAHFLPDQLKQVSDIVGSRQIDALSVSGGGNDALFAKILEECAIWENACHHDTELLDHVNAALAELPGRYSALNAALTDQAPAGRGPLNIAKVYLTEYPNPAYYDNGTMCNEMMGDILPGRVINLAETQWLLPNVMDPLNGAGADASNDFHWRRVDGIGSAFASPGQYGHGYCATHTGATPYSWMRTAEESARKQGPDTDRTKTKGIMHPNESGHRAISARLQFYLCDSIQDFTPVGAGVCAKPVDTVTRRAPAELTYGNVILAGVTRLAISATGPQPPANYGRGAASNYYSFSTTTSYNGGVQVCLTYESSDFPNENGLKLFQYDNGVWVDRTASHNPSDNRICGQATLPSTLAIFKPSRPPVVEAGGPYTVNEGASVILNGSGSDPDGGPVTFAWTSALPLSNPSIANPTLTGTNSSVQTLTLTDTDADGLTASDTATVTVVNVAPTAQFSAPTSAVPEGSPFQIRLTNFYDPSPADMTAGFSFAFDCGAGYGAFGSSSSANCTPSDNGTLTVKGKIKDQDGGTSEYSASVTVTNVAPSATFAAPAPVAEGSPFTLTLSAPVDAAGDLPTLQYAFTCGTGYGAFGSSNTVACPTTDDGTVAVKGQIKDKDGGMREYSASVTVNNVAPSATLVAPASAVEGSPLAISLTNPTDPSPADTAAGFSYAFDCGTGYGAFGASNSASCTLDSGARVVKAKIKDKNNGVREYPANITVSNVAPTATFSAPASAAEGVPFNVSFSNPVDPSSADVAAGFHYAFACTGGSLSGATYANSGASASAACTLPDGPGSYSVRARIIDKDGGYSEYTANMTASNLAPSATFQAPDSAALGRGISLSLVSPVDAPGDLPTLQYAFDCGIGKGYEPFSDSNSVSCPTVAAGVQTVRGQVKDKDGGVREYTASVTVRALLDVTIIAPGDGATFPINTVFDLTAQFTDTNRMRSHSCQVSWGDERVDDITPKEDIGSGTCSASHEYATPGQYTIKVTVTSSMGETATASITVTIMPADDR